MILALRLCTKLEGWDCSLQWAFLTVSPEHKLGVLKLSTRCLKKLPQIPILSKASRRIAIDFAAEVTYPYIL